MVSGRIKCGLSISYLLDLMGTTMSHPEQESHDDSTENGELCEVELNNVSFLI